MVFDRLNVATQDLINFNFLQNSKIALVLIVIFLSAAYVFLLKKEEKKTPYWTLGFIRIYITILAWVHVAASPLSFLWLAPEVSFWQVYNLYIAFYFIAVIMFIILFIADVLHVTPFLLLKMAGLDYNDKKVQDVYRKFFKRGRMM